MGLFSKITTGIGTALGGPVGGAIGGAVGSGLGALLQSKAAGSAADAFETGAREGVDLRAGQIDANTQTFAPFTGVGTTGASKLNTLLTDPGSFEGSPGHQFRLTQGLDEIDRRLSSQGLFNSGQRAKSLEEFRSGIASQEFGSEFQRLLATAGLGVNAASNVSSLNTGLTGANANAVTDIGQMRGGAQIAKGNAFAGGLNNLFETFGSNFSNSGGNVDNLLVSTDQRARGF